MQDKITSKIDSIVLDRAFGIPIFFLVMYAMFVFSMKVGGFFQNFFDLSTQAIFVDSIKLLLQNINLPDIKNDPIVNTFPTYSYVEK